jgi:amphi-Trp domain-containing protein
MSETVETVEESEANDDRDGKGKFKFESTMRRDEAVAYFEALVAGLKQGSLHFKQGARSLSVSPSSVLTIQVKAAKKSKTESISFEIEWRADGESELEISSS